MKNMIKITGSILTLTLSLSTSAFGHLGLPTTEAECLKTYDTDLPDVSVLTPESMCENAMKMPEVGPKCQDTYTKIQTVYQRAQQHLKTRCASAHELAAFDQACGADLASANCTQQASNLQAQALTFVQDHRKNVQDLQAELENAKNLGLEGAEKVVENLNDLNSIAPQVRDQGSQAAAEAGASNTNQALTQVHAGQSAAELKKIIEAVRNTSTISGDDVAQVDSMPAFESLQGAQIAKDMKADLGELDKKLAQQEADLKKAGATTSSRTAEHKSLTDNNKSGVQPGAEQQVAASSSPGAQNLGTAAAGAGALAGGLGASGGAGGSTAGSYEYQNPISSNGSTTLLAGKTGKANPLVAGASTSIDSKKVAAAGETAGTNSATAASKLNSSAAAALREKLRNQIGGGAGTSAEGAAASAAGAGILGPNGKPKAGAGKQAGQLGSNLSPEELSMLTGSTKLSGGSGFSLQGSETDASVDALVKDFESQLNSEGRGLASEAPGSVDDIGDEDSANLFTRMKGVFDRCLKKGCVSASRGSS